MQFATGRNKKEGAMLWHNYLKVALRNIRRQKIFSGINILGLALGMACCLVVLLFVKQELSFDRFHENSSRIYRIHDEIQRSAGAFETVRVASWIGPTLAEGLPEVKDEAKLVRFAGIVDGGGKRFDERLFFADPSFLGIFSFPLLRGDKDAALSDPTNVVITRKTAEKYFGSVDAMGKTLTVDGRYEFKVSGILADIPVNSHVQFDILAPFDHTRNIYGEERFRGGRVMAYTYLLLDGEVDAASLEEKIRGVVAAGRGEEYARLHALSLQPLTSIHLTSHTSGELGKNSRISNSAVLSAVALLVLLIACANYVNLSTAGAFRRSREVGVRKVIGADRRRLFRQFMGESMVLTFLALLLALAFVQATLPLFNSLMDRRVTLDFRGNPLLYLGFAGLAVFVGFVAGGYPALFLSTFRPVDVLKGKREKHRKLGLHVRKGLVVFQFVLAVGFITGTFLVSRQIDYIRTKDLGFDKERIVVVPPPARLGAGYEAFKSELLGAPYILDVTAATDVPGRHPGISMSFIPEGAGPEVAVSLDYTATDANFFDFYGMEIVRGRSFTGSASSGTAGEYVLNESAVKKLGWDEPLGRRLREERGESSGTVVGVVKDFHNVSLHEEIQPAVYQVEPQMFGAVAVRVAPGKTSEALDFIKARWTEREPYGLFYHSFLEDSLDALYREDLKIRRVFGFASVLTVFVACLGLLGLSIFLAEQKVKEIGIRKVLGATAPGIVALLGRSFGGPILLSVALACPLVTYAVGRWRENFSYHAPFSPWLYVLGGGLVLLVSLATISYQAVKSAVANPVDSLKYE
jgi:putative ABC transport system permease protein